MSMVRISQSEEIYWNDILEKFTNYNGSAKDFCKEYEVDKRKLYYRRQKSEKSKQPLFYGVKLDTSSSVSASHKYPKDDNRSITIEIGRARIFIPSDDINLLSNIIKELESSCLI